MSEPKFQEYAHDKYFNTKQSDIEQPATPGIHILRETEIKKMKKKLKEILLKK
jgi:hypothetical protein